MKFVLAPDSFKESMSAKSVAKAMERGIKKVMPDAECIHVPMADGGEGTVQSLIDATEGKLYEIDVKGPLLNTVKAEFAMLGDGKTAVIEMASASGIQLVKKEERNPLYTTTYGTGQIIKAALDRGATNIVIGIGGSATNDGGAGMIQALGARLLDKDLNELPYGGGCLINLQSIDLKGLDPRLKNVTVEVACDVNNPLIGPKGASYIFGPQKGATKDMVEVLDKSLTHYANIIKTLLNKDIAKVPGAGAAGGLGAGLMAFLDARLLKGVDIVIKHTCLEEKMEGADYVFTGEGSIDDQTIFGKTPIGVSKTALKHNIPVVAFAGKVCCKEREKLYKEGITAIIGIVPGIVTLKEALENGEENIERATESVVRLISI
ncbi:glycerate kinase [Clostridium algidicarnis]|uniref:glycerate kinase n=1 Tax=Clostridium algidicarnis TaxID=37659 RepID=UPI001C0B29BD|nr:glycerate kinase [Clostridium algidicarnis]MBU3196603.1 glycerate kinase [Clostridium algidicarnis]MBU3209955.1 glycerate kinase [Clostridium algidicarnis]MBU3228495.1 glycerate kinase [Clostridium algidicarnis]MBU3252238.1 glycerate kinase [Clostridium algidicarnis]